LKLYHVMLSTGPDFETSTKKVLSFFQAFQLIRYSRIMIVKEDSLPASSPDFWDRMRNAIMENRLILEQLLKELCDEGVTAVEDLEGLSQGYKSSMLHTVTHFLDGFFGVDTYFYNLAEDSHWVSEELTRKIRSSPAHFWLLTVEAET